MKLVCFEVCILLLVLQSTGLTSQLEDSCQNGGELLTGSYPKCSCPLGYKGFDCNQKVSPCDGEPCRNYGECLENEDETFTCNCSQKYDGMLCEKRVRACDSQPCKNGGNCSDNGQKCFKCECRSGYKGSDCSKKILPCEVSPCKHGGICSNKKDGDFKCTCINGYAGHMCAQKDGLYSSYILDGKVEFIKQLQEWLDEANNWHLCYRGSRDGWKTGDFHSRCDWKGSTVSIIRVGYYIFGGYTDIPWGGSNGYKRSTKSFIFSLRNRDNLGPFKSPIYRNYDHAIFSHPNHGIRFGAGGDIVIANNAHASSASSTNLGQAYKPPAGYVYNDPNTRALLPGNYEFLPTEVEVFYLA